MPGRDPTLRLHQLLFFPIFPLRELSPHCGEGVTLPAML